MTYKQNYFGAGKKKEQVPFFGIEKGTLLNQSQLAKISYFDKNNQKKRRIQKDK